MSVREYRLRFDSLARYAPSFVDTMYDRVRRFVGGLDLDYINACSIATLNDNMAISRIQAFAQGIEDHRHLHYMSPCEGSRASGSQQQRGLGQARTAPPHCATCSRMHIWSFRQGSTGCYSCGQEGHRWRNCPTIGQGVIGQLTRSVVGSSSSAQYTRRGPQTSAGRGRGEGREGASSFGS
ncbi:hypothetical protein R3W88_014979 [Solanum pinnatisectum]|uniref:CCHC-type domain-containing protein n=1 Tax=Solanum pinnatisectum TaxID=50273 RepID=A0AAV9KTS0_9SOLN|nr:hypothetical protein R3W88_014979 [Solanum pinnatisectum]